MSAAAEIIVAVGTLLLLAAIAVAVVRFARSMKVSVGSISAEFSPNGGKTLRDAIDRLTEKVDGHFAELFAKVDDHEARITALEKPKPRTPRKKAS